MVRRARRLPPAALGVLSLALAATACAPTVEPPRLYGTFHGTSAAGEPLVVTFAEEDEAFRGTGTLGGRPVALAGPVVWLGVGSLLRADGSRRQVELRLSADGERLELVEGVVAPAVLERGGAPPDAPPPNPSPAAFPGSYRAGRGTATLARVRLIQSGSLIAGSGAILGEPVGVGGRALSPSRAEGTVIFPDGSEVPFSAELSHRVPRLSRSCVPPRSYPVGEVEHEVRADPDRYRIGTGRRCPGMGAAGDHPRRDRRRRAGGAGAGAARPDRRPLLRHLLPDRRQEVLQGRRLGARPVRRGRLDGDPPRSRAHRHRRATAVFDEPGGPVRVRLRATDSAGAEDVAEHRLTVRPFSGNAPPQVVIERPVLPPGRDFALIAVAGEPVRWEASASDLEDPPEDLALRWEFIALTAGDRPDPSPTVPNPPPVVGELATTVVFGNVGNVAYRGRFSATDSEGETASANVDIFVLAVPVE